MNINEWYWKLWTLIKRSCEHVNVQIRSQKINVNVQNSIWCEIRNIYTQSGNVLIWMIFLSFNERSRNRQENQNLSNCFNLYNSLDINVNPCLKLCDSWVFSGFSFFLRRLMKYLIIFHLKNYLWKVRVELLAELKAELLAETKAKLLA